MSSPLTTPAIPVKVTAVEGQKTLYVHQAILRRIPFFSVQQERWATHGLSVKLPQGTSLHSLTAVLEMIYFPKKVILGLDTSQALRLIQVASMLNCDEALLDDLVAGLRNTLKSEADAKVVRAFCEEHEAPSALVQLATRLTKPQDKSKDFSYGEVQMMFRSGLSGLLWTALSEEREKLKFAEAHLKKRSRRGGEDVFKVAEILATEAATQCHVPHGYALALEFSSKHPAMFAFMAKIMFAKGTELSCERGLKYAVDFMEQGVTGVTTGSIDAADLVALCNLLSELTVTVVDSRSRSRRKIPLLVHTGLQDMLAGSMQRVNYQLQVKLCEVFCGMPDELFAQFGHAGLLSNLAVEPKALFGDRVVSLQDRYLTQIISVRVLELLGDKAKRFYLKAHLFKEDVRKLLFKAAMPDESDDGF